MTPEEIKQLKAENERLKLKEKQLEAELERKDDESAQKLEALRKGLKANKIVPVETQGEVSLSLVSKEGGKPKSAKFRIRPGFPKVRLSGYDVVTSKALMQVAQGNKLSEEQLEANPALKDWDKEKALKFLAEAAAINAYWLEPVSK